MVHIFQAVMENGKVYIRHVMLWEFKQGYGAQVTFDKICSVCGAGRVTYRTVRKFFAKFRSGNTTLTDELRVGRPSELGDNFLKATLEQNPRQSTRNTIKRMHTS